MKASHLWLIFLLVVALLTTLDDKADLAKCQERMSEAVCMHTLYP